MSRRRGLLSAAGAFLAALALAGCAGLPVTGRVNEGLPAGEGLGSPGFIAVPDRPIPGATPEQIVEGFIRAGTGPADSWAIARLFLAPEIAESWQPDAGVRIDVPGERVYASPAEGEVTLSLSSVATVDDTGAYENSEDVSETLPFRLAIQPDGEWRITEAPDGIVLDRDQFPNVFHDYALMYFDPTWQYLVPDVRWFPATSSATYISKALIDGAPSPWLAEAVSTAFPEAVELASPSVPVSADGVAQVELDRNALSVDGGGLSRMQAQLEASLATAGVSDVTMSVSSTALDVAPAQTRSTRIDPRPLVLTEDEFGFLAGDEIGEIAGLSDLMVDIPAESIELSPARSAAAVQLDDGTSGRVSADGRFDIFDTRPGIVAPTIDPRGFIWSVPRGAPSELVAYAPDGTPTPVGGALPGAPVVSSISISRDGTRFAATIATGGRTVVWVQAVVRDSDGYPQRLGDPIVAAVAAGEGLDLAWLDDSTLGLLVAGDGATMVVEQLVGGHAVSTASPADAGSLAAASATSSMRLWSTDGTLRVKRGANWAQTATGVLVLGDQQGAPQ
jgi:hypothetical protein